MQENVVICYVHKCVLGGCIACFALIYFYITVTLCW